MKITAAIVAAITVVASALLASSSVSGTLQILGQIEGMSLKTDTGESHAVPSAEHALTVLVFVAPDCPVANRYAPVLNELAAAWDGKGIALYRVYSDSEVDLKAIARHTGEFHLIPKALLDPSTECARRTGAEVTPEAIVLGRDGKIYYRGRIDDRYVEFGTYRREATRHDLREAVDAALEGKTLAENDTRAIGCYIPVAAPEALEEGAP